MTYKGIVLAGGLGTRLSPLTKIINKHLIPVYDKPLIFYSLSVLFLSKIRDILIICRKEDLNVYKKLLGDGSRFGINLEFLIQEASVGIPDAFIIGEKFIKNFKVALILGDNFFYGHQLTEKFLGAKLKNKNSTIFLYPVKNPMSYGIVEFDKSNKIKSIKEKPKITSSNLAITGFYLFDEKVSFYAKKIKRSKRNELEIVSLIKQYHRLKQLKIEHIGRGSAWLDTGTFENLKNASTLVENIENRQGLKIACLEEIALYNNWINKKKINESINFYGQCSYSDYLRNLVK
jgi:glucose-1-phosphate thymidylyltransferase